MSSSKKTRKLGAADAFFLQVESDVTPMHVASLNRYELPQGKDQSFILDLVEQARKHPINRPPFNLKLANSGLGKWAPAWVEDEDVDVDYHLRHMALPQPGGERELAVLISRLHSIPLDRSRPMWECYIIEGLADGGFVLYAKMHHALIDGVAGARMLQRSMSESRKVGDFVPFWAIPEPRKKRSKREPENAFVSMLKGVTIQARALPGVAKAITTLIRGSKNKDLKGLVAPYSAPECVLNLPIGPQRRVSTQTFAMDRFKKVAKAADGTLNDVVMAVCGGALRGYLKEIRKLPKTALVANVPVSVRPKDDEGGGNAISSILASLGTNIADPKKRFEAVKRSMTDNKTLLRRMSKTELANYSALMMAPFAIGQVSGIGNRARKPMYNVVVSNVPGPEKTLYLNGAKLVASQPVSLVFQGQALNITIFSYAGELNFVYTACLTSLPSVQNMVKHAEAALEELEAVYL